MSKYERLIIFSEESLRSAPIFCGVHNLAVQRLGHYHPARPEKNRQYEYDCREIRNAKKSYHILNAFSKRLRYRSAPSQMRTGIGGDFKYA